MTDKVRAQTIQQKLGFADSDLQRLLGHSSLDMDELARFISAYCEIGQDPVTGKDLTVTKGGLYAEYEKWGGSLSQNRFGKAMSEHYKDHRTTGGLHVWLGIGLKQS